MWLTNLLLVLICPCILPTLQWGATAQCDDPSPAFLLPNLNAASSEREAVQGIIKNALQNISAEPEYDRTSFSVEVTSNTETLFSFHHTAAQRDAGTDNVNGSSLYRIASITKSFTVLALIQQYAAGNLSLDDPVNKYISALNEPQNSTVRWKDITLRALASQIGGLSRDIAQQDLVVEPDVAASYGLPPATTAGLPTCDSLVNYTRSCDASDLLDWVERTLPLFAPNQKSSYSNLHYELLGLVLENVTGVPYSEYVTSRILMELNMTDTTFETPAESSMVIPKGIEYYWNFDVGIAKSTGGLYCSTRDMSKFMRYALTHFNGLALGLNWFQPTSYATGMQTFYGMPWEMFQTNHVLNTTRPISMITKAGGHPGYTTKIIMLPDYGLGISVFVAGEASALDPLVDVVTREMLRYADATAQKELSTRYAATYDARNSPNLNSTFTVVQTPDHGLIVDSWISNGSDAKAAFANAILSPGQSIDDVILYLVPTSLYVDEANREGERWRIVVSIPNPSPPQPTDDVFTDFCMTDMDLGSYAGLPLKEVIFWGGQQGLEVEATLALQVELTGFRVTLDRTT